MSWGLERGKYLGSIDLTVGGATKTLYKAGQEGPTEDFTTFREGGHEYAFKLSENKPYFAARVLVRIDGKDEVPHSVPEGRTVQLGKGVSLRHQRTGRK